MGSGTALADARATDLRLGWPDREVGQGPFQKAIASGKYTDGLPYAKKAVEIEPDNFAAYYALGRIYLELDEIAQALKNLEKAAAIAPDSSNVQFVLARADTRAKRPAEASRARAEFARLEALDTKRRGEATGPGSPPEMTDDVGKTSNP